MNTEFVRYCQYCDEMKVTLSVNDPCPVCGDELEFSTDAINRLCARVAELEAAAQWHPAGEPPEVTGNYLAKRKGFAQRGQEWMEHVYYEVFDFECPRDCIAWQKIQEDATEHEPDRLQIVSLPLPEVKP